MIYNLYAMDRDNDDIMLASNLSGELKTSPNVIRNFPTTKCDSDVALHLTNS